MSKKNTLAAGTSPFAHLLAGTAAIAGRAFGRRAEDDTDLDEDGPVDVDEVIDDTPVEDESEPNNGKRGRRGKKAEDDDADPDAEDGDDCDPDAEEPEDEKEAKAFRAGVAAANRRGAAIFGSKAATGRPDLAAQLVFGSRMSSNEAISFLATANTAPPASASALDRRMASRQDARPGADAPRGGGNGGKPPLAQRIAAAKQKAGIEA